MPRPSIGTLSAESLNASAGATTSTPIESTMLVDADTSTSRAILALRRIPSQKADTVSILSHKTQVPINGFHEMSTLEFCDTVQRSRSLKSAKIMSIKGYLQMLGIIPHRFLVIHLQRDERKDAWLRLDRRTDRSVGTTRLIVQGGVTESNDTVRSLGGVFSIRSSLRSFPLRRCNCLRRNLGY